MREIKFRAWDKKVKSAGSNGTMVYWDSVKEHLLTKYVEEDGYVLMQYTGLKDKYGRDIYEGDVIRRWNGGFGPIECRGSKFVVRFDEPTNYFEDLESYLYPKLTNGKERGEVIGNIYENPELISAPKQA